MKQHQSLVYYRRHHQKCTAAPDSMDLCDCIIWVKGRTRSGDPVHRQTTKTNDPRAAQRFGAELEAASLAKYKKPEMHGYTMPDAIELFMQSKNGKITEGVKKNYLRVLNDFAQFCYRANVSYIRELSVDVVEAYRYSLPHAKQSSRNLAINQVKTFLNTASRRGWITDPIVPRMEPVSVVFEQKEPYKDREIDLIMEGAEELQPCAESHAFRKNSHTFRLLLELALDTGMRIGDALLYDPARVRRGAFSWKYTFIPQKQKVTKEKKFCTVYPSDHIKDAIDKCEWLSPTLPFWVGDKTTRPTKAVYDVMQQIGQNKGVKDCRPHRLRDTFAVRQLLHGATLQEVAALLGHSSVNVTEKYYARWTEERESRLEDRLAARRLQPVEDSRL